MREQTLAGQIPDSTYGEAQRPTFKKERRGSEQAIILVICQDRTTFMKSPQFWGPVSLSLLASIATIIKCGSSSRATVSTGQLWKRKQLIPSFDG
ncbi:unnamed protein product [Sphagnum troendelagicum]